MELVCPLIPCPLDGSVKAVAIAALFLTQRRRRQPVIQGPNQSCSPCPIFSSSPIVLMAAADALVEMLATAAQPWPSPADRCTPRCGCAFPSPATASPVHGVMHRRQESSQPGAQTQACRCHMSGLNLRLCVRRVFDWYDSLCRPPQTTRQRRCSGRRCHHGKTMSPRDRRTGGLQVLPDASTNRYAI
jgi:hypothetical protein